MNLEFSHRPVLLQEVIHYLDPHKGDWYLDATLGDAGHTIALLKAGAKVLAFDQDEEAITRAKKNIETACPGVKIVLYSNQFVDIGLFDCILVNQNFSKFSQIVEPLTNLSLSGALFDLGISTNQLLNPKRGFSFQHDSPLDMRMDNRLGVTAADLVNALPQKQLASLFLEYADETSASKIAKAIVTTRRNRPFSTTYQLATLIERVKPSRSKIHPATKVFQALRIAVNLERESLMEVLPQVTNALSKGARLAVISFHSGEDRIVKHFLKDTLSLEADVHNPILPSQKEIEINPKSRSAKLRIAYKNV